MKAERHSVSMRELTMRPSKQNGYSNSMEKTLSETPPLRSELGDVLRGIRQRQGRTLREVSERMAIIDGAVIPDAVPDDIVPVTLIS